jgi:hypothetical protein
MVKPRKSQILAGRVEETIGRQNEGVGRPFSLIGLKC